MIGFPPWYFDLWCFSQRIFSKPSAGLEQVIYFEERVMVIMLIIFGEILLYQLVSGYRAINQHFEQF